ncbi:hypothetical protein EV356DRAFT_69650 [Viridothelium virens]|uniref:F-box domain-containing protein n=1 Tax=Viridothelium virens TaxID=1048519 RepID=A0A6A6HEP0_VIRVR|nr:hypothetical protein EV356DRAFT_69650 [Viridothelium virens]
MVMWCTNIGMSIIQSRPSHSDPLQAFVGILSRRCSSKSGISVILESFAGPGIHCVCHPAQSFEINLAAHFSMARFMDLPFEIRRMIFFNVLLPEPGDNFSVAVAVAEDVLNRCCKFFPIKMRLTRPFRRSYNGHQGTGNWGTRTIADLMCINRQLHAEVEDTCYSKYSFYLSVEQIPPLILATIPHIQCSIRHLDLVARLDVSVTETGPVTNYQGSKVYSAWSLLRRSVLHVQTVICRIGYQIMGMQLDLQPCTKTQAIELTMQMLRIWKDVPVIHVDYLGTHQHFHLPSPPWQVDDQDDLNPWPWEEEAIEECVSMIRCGQWG